MWKVIDVSRYQGGIDFTRVRNAGVHGVILRSGIGRYSDGALQEDSMFRRNIANCQNVGLPVGLYYFTQATTEAEAIAEANFTIAQAKQYEVKLPLVFDIENVGRITNQTVTQRTNNAIAFCKTIKAAGYEPVIYTYRAFFDSYIDEKALRNAGIDLWVAHYTSVAHPEYATNYVMWQYTSSGSIDGISGNVDMNFCYKDYFSGGSKVAFVKRTTAPSKTDPNYIKTTHGGKNHAMAINSSTGEVLANCCGYVHGRWCELGLPEEKLCRNNAEIYWGYNDGFARGQEPKRGAIACWRKGTTASGDGAGHVAIVEDPLSKTSVVLSQSNYGGTRWYTGTYNPNTWPGGTYVFQGYIYPPVNFDSDKVGSPVERNKYCNQIDVKETVLRARSSATNNITTNILGIVNTGLYNVYETTTADGYVWARIESNMWIATKESEWTISYPAEVVTPSKVKIGPASSGDINTISKMLDEKGISFELDNSCIYTTVVVSTGDKKSIMIKCEELDIPCVDYVDEPEDNVEQLEAEIKQLQDVVKTQEAELIKVNEVNAALQGENANLVKNVETLDATINKYDASMDDIKEITEQF